MKKWVRQRKGDCWKKKGALRARLEANSGIFSRKERQNQRKQEKTGEEKLEDQRVIKERLHSKYRK